VLAALAHDTFFQRMDHHSPQGRHLWSARAAQGLNFESANFRSFRARYRAGLIIS